MSDETEAIVGSRRVRVVCDGDPMTGKLHDCETGEDLTEKYEISRIVVCIDRDGVFANVTFRCAYVDIFAFVQGARTERQQEEIFATAEQSARSIENAETK